VIAVSPNATGAAVACAWCERPLPEPAPDSTGRLHCGACGATTVLSRPAPSSAAGRAPRHASRLCSLGEAARRQARRRLAERVARVAPPGAVLDVGSDGALLDALRLTGRLVTGIARPATRAGVQDVEITELGGRYAAIVFWQSLGRLRTPSTALEHAAALLKPGGLLAIAQPSAGRERARALGERWLARGVAHERVHIPEQALLARLRTLGLEVEHVDHPLDADRLVTGPPAVAWLHGLLGGIVSIEARR
jgi:hypothetical protein